MTLNLFPHVPVPQKVVAGLLVWGSAPVLAYLVRFDGRVPEAVFPGLWWLVGVGLVAKAVMLFRNHLNEQSWKHASFRDTVQVVKAVGIVGAIEVVAGLISHTQLPLPRSTLPLLFVLGTVGLYGVRALRRGWHLFERRRGRASDADEPAPRRALIVGAGEAGGMEVREMLRHPVLGSCRLPSWTMRQCAMASPSRACA